MAGTEHLEPIEVSQPLTSMAVANFWGFGVPKRQLGHCSWPFALAAEVVDPHFHFFDLRSCSNSGHDPKVISVGQENGDTTISQLFRASSDYAESSWNSTEYTIESSWIIHLYSFWHVWFTYTNTNVLATLCFRRPSAPQPFRSPGALWQAMLRRTDACAAGRAPTCGWGLFGSSSSAES